MGRPLWQHIPPMQPRVRIPPQQQLLLLLLLLLLLQA
jgi:hypothetical protein